MAPSGEGWTPGGGAPGGKRTHFLRPRTTPLNADVPLGSTCMTEPEPAGPTISQIMLEVHYNFISKNTVEHGLALHEAIDAAGYAIVSSEWNALTGAADCLKEYVFVRRNSGLLLP